MTANANHQLQPTNCLILGLGQTGLSCAKFLVQHYVDVAVMDTRERPPSLAELQQNYPEVVVKTGGLDLAWMKQADMIVLSPGIDPRLPEIVAAREAGVEMVGDIELFSRYANAPIVAITGSNGKSTVTTLLAEMAEAADKVIRVGGNLGTPALDLITEPAPDFYIVELSSFQLETVKTLNAFAAAILNVSPDHLDRYDSIEDYQQAKARIFNGDGVMVINREDAVVNELSQMGRNQIGFSLHATEGVDFGLIEQDGQQWLAEGEQALLAVTDMKIVGKHNIANALAALALGSAMALPMAAMLSAIQAYRGLAHRCRLVDKINDVRWFNDSKATNVGATIAAIEGLAGQGDLILLAGGVAKDQDFSTLTAVLAKHIKAVVLFGQDAQQIEQVVPDSVTTLQADTLELAVTMAAEQAVAGSSVLLSPACASFDMFDGYVQRGDAFEQAVQELK
ncbi:UDP-N-acetylmuramoylalanine--D-glutamate ligase [Methylophaga sp. 41_12_T18]|nr:UDP-N-acetylmuramoylalanine--D-glutamate ligase [Methylophaga sp. 41_12_T18]